MKNAAAWNHAFEVKADSALRHFGFFHMQSEQALGATGS